MRFSLGRRTAGQAMAGFGTPGGWQRSSSGRYTLDASCGAVRLLGYLNEARMGSYQAALAFPGTNIAATRENRYKYGFGLNWEQEITRNVGVFSRLGWNDGHQEGWMFTDINYTASAGVSIKGGGWHRADDIFGLAGVISGASHAQQEFLAAGGTGILDGDGALSYGIESVLETYYDCKLWENPTSQWTTSLSPTPPLTELADRSMPSARESTWSSEELINSLRLMWTQPASGSDLALPKIGFGRANNAVCGLAP